MMHLLSTAVAPEVTEAAEVNSWHTLLAIFIVAFVLLAIWAIRTTYFGDASEEESAPAPAPKAAAPVAAPASNDVLIAVITAAVAAAMQEENGGAPAPAFRVVSFRKIS